MVTKYPDINQQSSPHIPQSAISQQALPRIPQSANYSHFTEQARRAGYTGPELGRTQQHFHPYSQSHSLPLSHPLSLSNPQPPSLPLSRPLSLSNWYSHPRSFPPPHSHEMQEAIQREIEKQRIREEIIMSEILRRRALEAEVRREIMIERELALQRGNNGIPSGSSSVIGFESPTRIPRLGTGPEGRSLEERIILSLAEERLKNGGFETSPFRRRPADLRISEVKPVSEGGKEKRKIILLAKPDEDISGSKRKAVIPPAGPDSSEPPSGGGILGKKVKEEWSCSVCQVSATSEQTLNEHLNGKKHKSKEAALKAQRAGKNFSIGLFPKKVTKSIEGPGAGHLGPSESLPLLTENLNSDNFKKNQSVVVPLLTVNLESDNYEKNQSVVVPLLMENLISNNSNNTQSVVVQEAQKKDYSKKKKHRLWCELCQVGSYSRKVMNFHRRGKKHARQLEASQRNAPSHKETKMVVNLEGVDEDGKKVDEGLKETARCS